MKTIWKYTLPVGDGEINMRQGAEILTVQTQGNIPYLWAIVDTEKTKGTRKFILRGTGHIFTGEEGKYIGTFQLINLGLVFHVFEKKGE